MTISIPAIDADTADLVARALMRDALAQHQAGLPQAAVRLYRLAATIFFAAGGDDANADFCTGCADEIEAG